MKLFRIFFNLTSYFFNKINYIVIDKFLKYRNTYIVFLREDRIGHQAGNTDIEFFKALKRKKETGSKTIFIFPTPDFDVSNLYLRNKLIEFAESKLFKTYVIKYQFINRFFSRIFFEFLLKIFKSCKNIYFSNSDTGPRITNLIIKKSSQLEILCEKLGINPNGYICITSRDSNYLNKRFPNRNWDYHDHRNVSIDNLKKLSDYVRSEFSYDVVRIGSNPEKKISWSSEAKPKVIDYSFSKYKSPRNDIDLISGCKFFINNGGGPVAAAVAARREIITINHIPIRLSIGFGWWFWIPKLLKKKNHNKYLSFRDIEKLNLSKASHAIEYKKLGIEIIENNDEDILNALKDYFKIKNRLLNKEEKQVLNIYRENRNETAHLHVDKKLRNYKDIISPTFLLKYPELLN